MFKKTIAVKPSKGVPAGARIPAGKLSEALKSASGARKPKNAR